MAKIEEEMKVISQCFVKPKYEVEASKQSYHLNPTDLIFLRLVQMQRGLLFSSNPEKNIRYDFMETLKDALAVSLVHFYPLAGRYTTQELRDENMKWVYLDCTKGPGAHLIHAKVDLTVLEIISSVDVHPIVRSCFDQGETSINYDGHHRSLLSIQVTELIDGVFIGFTMNHSVADGNSLCHFINSLSEIFLQLSQSKSQGQGNEVVELSRKPVFKPWFHDGLGPILKLRDLGVNNNGSIPQSISLLRERIFHFSSESISLMKANANKDCKVHNINISSFQSLSGFMWRSITRARNLQPEHDTCCWIAVNTRPRLSPPVSNDYFGNYVGRQQTKCNVGELLYNSYGWAAMLVHRDLVSYDENKVREGNEFAVKLLSGPPNDAGIGSPSNSPNFVMMAGSARFDMYGPQFGLGKAQAVLVGNCNAKDGKIIANPGREGGGSVDLQVCLKIETMNALEIDEEFMSYVTLKYT